MEEVDALLDSLLLEPHPATAAIPQQATASKTFPGEGEVMPRHARKNHSDESVCSWSRPS
jgi:hypothetical protein